MKFAVLGDIHGNLKNLKKIRDELKLVDAIFVTGDIAGTISLKHIIKSIIHSKKISRNAYAELVYTKYREEFTNYQLKTTKKTLDFFIDIQKPVFVTHGNVELPEVREMLKNYSVDHPLFYYLGNKIIEYNGLIIVGYGYCTPATYREPLQTPGEKTITEIKADLITLSEEIRKTRKGGEKRLIGLFHEPPKGTNLDYIEKEDLHGGSQIHLEHISQIKYDYVFVGHIHESPGLIKKNSAVWLNPGPMVSGNWAKIELNSNTIEFFEIKRLISIKKWIYTLREIFK